MNKDTLISYRGVDIYQQELNILKGINLEVNKGDFIYLLGEVGSGKSSLIKSFYSEVPISSGDAMVIGYDMNKIKEAEVPFLRRRLGIIFQDFQLLIDRTIKENFEFVLRATNWKDKNAINLQIESVLHQVGMSTKAYKKPYQLSGGEQQRIVIARALLNSPEIILADEPTGNLDPVTGREFLNLLCEINRAGTTVVMATHNWNWVEQFPGRIVRCFKGALHELSCEEFADIAKSL